MLRNAREVDDSVDVRFDSLHLSHMTISLARDSPGRDMHI